MPHYMLSSYWKFAGATEKFIFAVGLYTATEQEKWTRGYNYSAILYWQFKHERHARNSAFISTVMVCKLWPARCAAWECISALNSRLLQKIEHHVMLICTECLECCIGLFFCGELAAVPAWSVLVSWLHCTCYFSSFLISSCWICISWQHESHL